MKLSYRGVSYEFTPPTLEVTEGEILGKYRSASWRCHTLAEAPIPQLKGILTYRGVAYQPNQVTSASTTLVARNVGAKIASSISTPKVFPIRKQAEQVHRSNLLRNLERRLQVAKERGDQNLVNLLEAESRQLV